MKYAIVLLGLLAVGLAAIVANKKIQKCYKVESNVKSDKVKVSLYFESLCPGCHEFIVNTLAPTYLKPGVSDILEVELVPYGNADYKKEGEKITFTCQHGQAECKGNKLFACAFTLYPDNDSQVKFLQCAENSDEPQNSGEQCSTEAGLDWNKINQCLTSDEGDNYVYNMALKTDALQPAHEYVPWVLVNGDHSYEEQAEEDLLKLACDLYKGTKPDVCTQ